MQRAARLTSLLGVLGVLVGGQLAPAWAQPRAGAAAPVTARVVVGESPRDESVPSELAVLLTLRRADPQVAVLRAWAGSHGLTVGHVTSASLLLSGPPSRLAGLFGVTLTATPEGVPYARTPLRVPVELAAVVRAAVGLDARPMMAAKAVPVGLTGADLRAAYDVPAGASAGAGTTVGTLQFSGWAPSDLTTYADAAGITLATGQITEVGVAGADPHLPDGTGGEAEVALDVEAVLATAPAARQRIYVAPNTAVGSITAINQMADDAEAGLLQVTSSSWGSCEAASDLDYRRAFGAGLDRLVAAGATFFVASGDMGAYGCSSQDAPDNALSVDFPSSWPVSVAVGGTTLTNRGGAIAETAWGTFARPAQPGTFAGSGSGGGISADTAQPAYQQGLWPGTTTRLVPDVASVADPSTGFGAYVASHGGWLSMGGTSLAAPTWAGFTAAALSAAGRTTGLGNILPALYAHPSAFHDVTAGNNGAYTAAAGFDLVTGLGSPDWNALASVLLGAPVLPMPATPFSIESDPPPVAYRSAASIDGTAAANSLVTLHFHRAGTPAGDYSIVRTVRANSRGAWSRLFTPETDYRYYATVATASSGTATSATVLVQPVPTLAGPATRQVRRGATYLWSGTAVPGSVVSLNIHAAGTPAADYSIVRRVRADASGRWTRSAVAAGDYRMFVARFPGARTAVSPTVLLQAR